MTPYTLPLYLTAGPDGHCLAWVPQPGETVLAVVNVDLPRDGSRTLTACPGRDLDPGWRTAYPHPDESGDGLTDHLSASLGPSWTGVRTPVRGGGTGRLAVPRPDVTVTAPRPLE